MKRIVYAFACAAILMSGCNKFKKTKEGVMYKIITDDKGEKLKNGDFFEMSFRQVYKGTNLDSVLEDSKDFGNQIVPLDSALIPPVYYKYLHKPEKATALLLSNQPIV